MKEYRIGEPRLAWWLTEIEECGGLFTVSGSITGAPAQGCRLAADGKVIGSVKNVRGPVPGTMSFRGPLPLDGAFRGQNEIVLRMVSEASGEFVTEWNHFHLARTAPRPDIPLPPPKLTQRATWADPALFDKWGYALKRKYEEAVKPYAPALNKGMRLLDWGCGAGRLARYLVDQVDYQGIDIDQEAITWCSGAIPGGKFQLQGLEARTRFDSGVFDLVIGISIFTHLREEEQFAWLAELARIAKPDAIVAVSVCGATSLFNANDPPSVRETFARRKVAKVF